MLLKCIQEHKSTNYSCSNSGDPAFKRRTEYGLYWLRCLWTFAVSWILYSFFSVTPRRSEFYVSTFRNTVSSIFISGVSRKNCLHRLWRWNWQCSETSTQNSDRRGVTEKEECDVSVVFLRHSVSNPDRNHYFIGPKGLRLWLSDDTVSGT